MRSAFCFVVAASLLAGCSGAAADKDVAGPTTPATPVVPTAPKPAIVLSSDSVSASLLSGAASVTHEIEVTAGNTTSVTGLAVSDSGAAPTWLTVSVSTTTAPAKLSVRLSPATVTPGRYDAMLRVSAPNADTKTVRVSLVVRPRPRLVLERATLALSGEIGGTFAPSEIKVTSVDGAIDSLSIGKVDCGSGPANWLTPTLSATTAPATLRLGVSASGLNAGTYACSMVVTTTQALVDSAAQTVRVSLALKAVPRIATSWDTLPLMAFRLNDGSPVTVQIMNAGSGTLNGLSVGPIEYDAGGSGWLTTTLDSSTAPTRLTVVATARSLATTGMYNARVPIRSTAEGVADTPKWLVVTLNVQPRPSVLITVPSVVNLTVRAGGSVSTSVSVTHSGDSQIDVLGFGLINPLIVWGGYSLGCSGVYPVFRTPCTGMMLFNPPSTTAPGTYTAVVPYIGAGGMRTSVTVNVKVIP